MHNFTHGDLVNYSGQRCTVIRDNGTTVVITIVCAPNELPGTDWTELDRWVWQKEVKKEEVDADR